MGNAKRREGKARGHGAPESGIDAGERGDHLEDGAFLHCVVDGHQLVGHVQVAKHEKTPHNGGDTALGPLDIRNVRER